MSARHGGWPGQRNGWTIICFCRMNGPNSRTVVAEEVVLLSCMSRSCWPFDVVYLLFVSNNIGEILICARRMEKNVALCLKIELRSKWSLGLFDFVSKGRVVWGMCQAECYFMVCGHGCTTAADSIDGQTNGKELYCMKQKEGTFSTVDPLFG